MGIPEVAKQHIQGAFLHLHHIPASSIVVIKRGGTAEVAIGGVIRTIDSIINRALFLVVKWSRKGEIVKEGNILITTL